MSMRLTIKGGRELDALLTELPPAVAQGVVRRGLKRALKPVQAEIESRAPELTGKLKSSIVTEVHKRKDIGSNAARDVYKRGGTAAEAKAALLAARSSAKAAGNGAAAASRFSASVVVSAPHARFLEFGTEKMTARAFIRPAWDAVRDAAAAILMRETWDELRKTAGRRARKARRNGESAKLWDEVEKTAAARSAE